MAQSKPLKLGLDLSGDRQKPRRYLQWLIPCYVAACEWKMEYSFRPIRNNWAATTQLDTH